MNKETMTTLPTNLRNDLSRVVVQARDLAEAGARVALEALAVHHHEPYTHMDMKARKLRNRLRAHGRQLGDQRNPRSGVQAIQHLVEEFAYEHWHRMLFARFLAENDLLIDPELEVAITLDECRQLAREEGTDQWTLAGRYAQQMLPQIFRTNHPVFQVDLARNDRVRLEQLLESLTTEAFQASDSLGWVYQFWQAKKKEEVNASEVKIGANELPAVTQLFTEDYMVSFLLDNSLGAWWAARNLSEADLKNANSEAELRNKAAIPGVPLDYLRFVQQEDGTWTPAAGTFDSWPEHLNELRTLDPCCGSGHFLVAAFLMLVPMRMERENLSTQEAVDAVLRENIHGLELDQRCVELAAFALALTAWKYPNAGGYRPFPEMNLACSGLPVGVAKEEWKKLALDKHNLRIALDWMHDTFHDAPLLGSLLNPAKTEAAKLVQWDQLSNALEQALGQEENEEQYEAAVAAQGLAKAATLLGGQYQWVITNVPYLARGKQNSGLRDFCEKHYPAAKNDLATVFLERCLEFCLEGGTTSVVLPQNWLFLTRFKKFREKLLKIDTWQLIARLGPGAFETISGEVVKAILIIISRGNATVRPGELFGGTKDVNLIRGVDASQLHTVAEKAAELLAAEIKSVEQVKQLENPDATIKLEKPSGLGFVRDYAGCYQGLTTGDDPRLKRKFWEFQLKHETSALWKKLQGPSQDKGLFAGRENLVDCRITTGELRTGALRGRAAWGKKGVAIDRVTSLAPALYCGDYYHSLIPVLIPKSNEHLPAILAFAISDELKNSARRSNQSLSIDNGYFEKFEFDLDRWSKVAEDNYPNGLPEPYSNAPTQWIFHGHPCGSVLWNEEDKRIVHGCVRIDDTVLQVAIARMLGYRWPAELDTGMELADEQREWVNRCAPLLTHADNDGIVCLPAINRELPAHERLLSLLESACGDDWHPGVLTQLLQASGCKGKSLEVWLQDKFFEQHCKLFQHRPFIWHIWDGLRDGFSALVNYHKLDKAALDRLIYSYLGDWIRRQEAAAKAGEDGAEERLVAAKGLKRSLEAIKAGEAALDIFVRWKPLEEQAIGWDPDLNDGVRLNIRPFMTVDDVGRKGAGILRWKPNIHWKKDRGKDVVSAPWYPVFQGDRINDHHLTLEEKKEARAAKDSAE